MKIEINSSTGCTMQLDRAMIQDLKQIAYANKTTLDAALESLIRGAINPGNDRRSVARVKIPGGHNAGR